MQTGGLSIRQQIALSAFALAATAVALFAEYVLIKDGNFDHVFGMVAWVAWMVLPPLWFLWDWSRQPERDPNSAEAQSFRYSQELAGKLWIGVGTVLTVLQVWGVDCGKCP